MLGRDPTSLIETVRALNPPWWCDDDAHGSFFRALFEVMQDFSTRLDNEVVRYALAHPKRVRMHGKTVDEWHALFRSHACHSRMVTADALHALHAEHLGRPAGAHYRVSETLLPFDRFMVHLWRMGQCAPGLTDTACFCQYASVRLAEPSEEADIRTHPSPHHFDDIVSTVMAAMVEGFQSGGFRTVTVVRSRSNRVRSKWCLDVGGVYDPANHRYDHHQAADRVEAECAASLVWRNHHADIIGAVTRCGLEGGEGLVAAVRAGIDPYVSLIAANDNAQLQWTKSPAAVDHSASHAFVQVLVDGVVDAYLARHPQMALDDRERARTGKILMYYFQRLQLVEEGACVCRRGGKVVVNDDTSVVHGLARRGLSFGEVRAHMQALLHQMLHEQVQEKYWEKHAARMVEEAFDRMETEAALLDGAAAVMRRRYVVLDQGVKDVDRLVHAEEAKRFGVEDAFDSLQVHAQHRILFVAWYSKQERAYIFKGVQTVPGQTHMGSRAHLRWRDGHAVKRDDVRFVHKKGWIGSCTTLRTCHYMVQESIREHERRHRD